MGKRKVTIMMHTEEGEFPYGTYPYETAEEKERVVNIMLEIQKERKLYIYKKEV